MSLRDRSPGHDPLSPSSAPALDCDSTSELLHADVEDELSGALRAAVGAHLASCAKCRRARLALEDDRLSFLEAAVASPELPLGFAGRITRRLHREESARRTRLRRRWAISGLAAAGLIAALISPLLRREMAVAPVASSEAAPGLPSSSAERASPAREPLARPSRLGAPLVGGVPGALDEALRTIELSPTLVATVSTPSPRLAAATRGEARGAVVRSWSQVLGMAADLSERRRSGAREPSPRAARRDDPCRPDPNGNGQMDIEDLAYSCQLLVHGQPPAPLEPESVGAREDEVDCEGGLCLRV